MGVHYHPSTDPNEPVRRQKHHQVGLTQDFHRPRQGRWCRPCCVGTHCIVCVTDPWPLCLLGWSMQRCLAALAWIVRCRCARHSGYCLATLLQALCALAFILCHCCCATSLHALCTHEYCCLSYTNRCCHTPPLKNTQTIAFLHVQAAHNPFEQGLAFFEQNKYGAVVSVTKSRGFLVRNLGWRNAAPQWSAPVFMEMTTGGLGLSLGRLCLDTRGACVVQHVWFVCGAFVCGVLAFVSTLCTCSRSWL